jgi:hypothetical protein
MIYETVKLDDPIVQGDIFRDVPRVDLSLATMAVVDSDGQRELSWIDAIDEGSSSPITAVLPIKPVTGIVITQDCDNERGEYLCLSEMEDFLISIGQDSPPTNPKKWQSLVTKHLRANPRLFYLPAESGFGLEKRMAADFRVVLRVPRVDLESMKSRRICTLNHVAKEHFRESLAHFFRRYALNEWYPLTKEEFDAYSEKAPDSAPYPWQR